MSKNVIVLDIVVDFREDEFTAAAHTQQDKQVQMKVLMNLHYFMGCYCCSSARSGWRSIEEKMSIPFEM